ncbi:MAG TPA: hypothetical protein VFZ22_01755 [Pyrinomonadaceae bacterium]|nr:hypothetical protein [Pyrinomonadaceae bacterium]
MPIRKGRLSTLLITGLLAFSCVQASQGSRASSDDEFGPVVRAYLGYLRNEQEVVDDRVSRHEVSATYYRRNSNRIRALRQMAIRLARESHNDYLPELEAVAANELRQLFGSEPPQLSALKTGDVLRNTFRYLGVVRSGEPFYLFARLDPYEQAELSEKAVTKTAAGVDAEPKNATRSRRVVP